MIEATQTLVSMRTAGMHHAWTALFFTALLSWVPWAVVTPMVLRLAREYPLFRGTSLVAWLRHAGACVAIGVGAACWDAAIENWLNPYVPDMHSPGFLTLWRSKATEQMVSTVVLYGIVLLVGWILQSRERLERERTEAARLSEQLAKAQLGALRQQIEPHFLFNTLNTIAGLVREGRNDAAVDMIAGLSELLRRTLRNREQQVALRDELEIVETYLEIEKARFAERLRVHVDVPQELARARVPSLILQPLVENAVKHGIAKRASGGVIAIHAERRNGTLTLRVADDGPGFPEEGKGRSGIGLENVRERLRSLYGPAGKLQVGREEGWGAVVSVSVPYEETRRQGA
ncbi:MAG TPA: histidine kinase [Candidatus Eremiobacteraceae bacterium]|nr:histidine kinase [Candidatus Eremiobacteraceae bacterium]